MKLSKLLNLFYVGARDTLALVGAEQAWEKLTSMQKQHPFLTHLPPSISENAMITENNPQNQLSENHSPNSETQLPTIGNSSLPSIEDNPSS